MRNRSILEKAQNKLRSLQWRSDNLNRWNTNRNEARKKRRTEDRLAAIQHYGGACACCDERIDLFLTLDHIDNDGAEHRRQIATSESIWAWLRINNYPPGFRVLCWNCNSGRARNGGVCPHEGGDFWVGNQLESAVIQ